MYELKCPCAELQAWNMLERKEDRNHAARSRHETFNSSVKRLLENEMCSHPNSCCKKWLVSREAFRQSFMTRSAKPLSKLLDLP